MSKRKAYIVVLMGVGRIYRIFPICYWNEIIPYCYDCWPSTWPAWQSFFIKNKVKAAFFTSKQAALHFSSINSQMYCKWLPEATYSDDYLPQKKLKHRNIDILELGRRYSLYHKSIVNYCSQYGYKHLYEEKASEILFPTTQQLIEGFADSKICLCFPAALTHPEKAQGVETVTHRYFESMASKCLIVGKCPGELLEIFGYNPVIEVDMKNPFQQLLGILNTINSYQDLVNSNYERLLEIGTWEVRIQEMVDILTNELTYCL
ncbi:hypothetical protein [Acaryochloris sp. IP29b_bin.148]|uniref:hypothetical protein n=1 Tax=Acaryochloris sp. IP29b_bin.148 TaxID=2969218 RepID=UPI0026307E08|nr:hypothetical protein [Acaryochloris sp. IP29b_bin.148]